MIYLSEHIWCWQTFYVNLDLSSSHGPIRPPRRRTNASDPTTGPSIPSRSAAEVADADEAEAEAEADLADLDNPNRNHDHDHDPEHNPIQILDLHTRNPIITYQNHVFSCTWADLLGTELLLTSSSQHQHQPDDDNDSAPPPPPPLLKTGKDYDLLAANSVKILGRRANLISSSSADPTSRDTTAANRQSGVPYPPGVQSNQSRFLQRLASVKQAKGETDTVRTVFTARRTQHVDGHLRALLRSDEHYAEIQRLTEASMQGDRDASVQLENLRGQLGLQGESAG